MAAMMRRATREFGMRGRPVALLVLAIGMALGAWAGDAAPTGVLAQTATDLTIAHLEFIQVVQRWDNSVPLVVKKPVVVRVYVEANGPNGPLTGGRWDVGGRSIQVYHGTTLLGTLGPTAKATSVAPTPVDPHALRGNAADTVNFLIPATWTFTDGIRITVTINTGRTTPETNYLNNTFTANLDFVPVYPLNVYGLMFADPQYPYPAVPYSNYNAHIDYLRTTWPVNTVNLYQPPSPALTYNTRVNVDANDPYFPGGGKVAGDADALRRQASAPYNGYYWYALQPWDTCLCGMATVLNQGNRGATGQDNRRSDLVGTVMAQEIAHNFDLLHTGHVASYADTACCPSGTISQFPTDPNKVAAGFDIRTMQVINIGDLAGNHAHDFMAYAQSLPIWPSDYSYEKLLNKLKVVLFGAGPAPDLGPQTPSVRPYLFASGLLRDGTATLDPAYTLDLTAGDDEPGSGAYALDLRDADDRTIFTRNFDPTDANHEGALAPAFLQLLPFDARARGLVLRRGDQVLAERRASAGPPSVRILTPRPDAHWDGARTVTWEAADADGDQLTFAVQYSADNGATWLPVAAGVQGTSLDVDADLLAGSRECLVRVIASDGFNTTVAVSGVFGVELHLPRATIVSAPVVLENGQLLLTGDGYDADDGALPDERLVWTSDRDGTLGTGQTLVTTPLSAGRHTITLTATDRDGNTATATIVLTVVG
jgi:hypothetical protein